MAITTAVCTSFKSELLQGIHALGSGGDSIKLALFLEAATLNATTTAYANTNESSGTGYTAGGDVLTGQAVATSGTTAYLDFANLTFSSSTITANGCLIYNDTKADRAMQVHAFGTNVSSINGDFTITFPTADASNAIFRLA